ncbi:hypothetical protein YPPY58_1980, partial [Yersinia pestis PY-58]
MVGRPISLLNVWESSNNPPCAAPASESASIPAKPSGKPALIRACLKSASDK